jgi:hypothetical protein
MSARQRAPERIVSPRLSIPEWQGVLSRTDIITGNLICSSTGWRLKMTGTADGKVILLTAQFDSPVFGDDAFPGAIEGEIVKPHEKQAAGYDCFWTGSIKTDDRKAWAGEMGDRYGGRLALTGKAQGPGVISLRAVASVGERG